MHLSPALIPTPVVYTAACSKAMVLLLLLVRCLLLLSLFMGVLWLVLVLLFSGLCPSSGAVTLMRKRELVAFSVVLWL